jgi:hypothetical protein
MPTAQSSTTETVIEHTYDFAEFETDFHTQGEPTTPQVEAAGTKPKRKRYTKTPVHSSFF